MIPDLESFTKYPLWSKSAEYVKKNYGGIDQMLLPTEPRVRAKNRVLAYLSEESKAIYVKNYDGRYDDAAILSFPLTRLLVMMSGEMNLLKKFAAEEASRTTTYLVKEGYADLVSYARDMGLKLQNAENGMVSMRVVDYVRYASSSRRADLRLANRPVINGYVVLDKDTLIGVLEQVTVQKLLNRKLGVTPEQVDKWSIDMALELREVNTAWAEYQKKLTGNGIVQIDSFPPCMSKTLGALQSGHNVSHTARYALTAFLTNIGMTQDDIMDLFQKAPNFREDVTRYQVHHIATGAGTEYVAPTCKTMNSYGNCPGQKGYCKYIEHPLVYYRRTVANREKLQNKMKAAQQNQQQKKE